MRHETQHTNAATESAKIQKNAQDSGQETGDDTVAESGKKTSKPQTAATIDKKTAKAKQPDAAAKWFVRADEDVFGPVEKAELDDWASEGRLDAECHVRCEKLGRGRLAERRGCVPCTRRRQGNAA